MILDFQRVYHGILNIPALPRYLHYGTGDYRGESKKTVIKSLPTNILE